MVAAPDSVTSKLRELRSRHLSTSRYLSALTELADLEFGSEGSAAIDRVTAMRLRIEALERKVRELEAHK
jgi:hypothetical protein